jgi:hypothetical protein
MGNCVHKAKPKDRATLTPAPPTPDSIDPITELLTNRLFDKKVSGVPALRMETSRLYQKRKPTTPSSFATTIAWD